MLYPLSLSVRLCIYLSISLSLWRKSHFATTTSRFDQTLPVIHSSLHSHLSWSHFDTNENYNYLIYHSWKEKGLFQSLFLSSKKGRLFILFYLFRRNVEYFAGEGLGRVLLATILDLLGSPYIRTADIRAIFIFKHDSYRHIRLPIRIKYFFVYNPFSRLQSSAASKLRLEGNGLKDLAWRKKIFVSTISKVDNNFNFQNCWIIQPRDVPPVGD